MIGNIIYPVILLGTPFLLAWLIKKNVKSVVTILIGIISFAATISLFPLLEILAHFNKMSSKPLVQTFALIFIVCTIVFIILTGLCIASIIKTLKSKTEGNNKFVKAIYIVSVLVSVLTLLTMILSVISEAGFGMSIARFLFSQRGGQSKLFLAINTSFLTAVFGITGLIILKNEQKVKPDEAIKALSNYFFLSVTSIFLLFISFFTISVSFMGFFTINGIFCTLASVVVSLLSFSIFIAMLLGGLKPERVQKFLKKVFPAIILIAAILTFDFLVVGRGTVIIVCSLLVLVLSTLGFFLAKKSRIDIENEENEEKPKTDPLSKIKSVSSDDIARGAEILKQKTTVYSDITVAIYQVVFKRAKQMLLNPQTEYLAIEQEDMPHEKILKSYVLPLLLIPALFAFIGYGLVGYSMNGRHFNEVGWGFRMAIVQILVMLGGIYLPALILNALADNFGATKNFNRAFSLISYAYTPMILAGIFHIHHSLWWIVFLVGLYGLYLLFVGMKPMLKPAEDKAGTFSVIMMIVTVVGYYVLFQVLKAVVLPANFAFM